MYPGKRNGILSPLLCLYGPLILPVTPTEEFFFEGLEKYTLFIKYPGFHYFCFHSYYCICISLKASSSSKTVVTFACGGHNVLTFAEEESLS